MNGVNPDCPEDEDGGVVVEESDMQVLGKGRDGKSGEYRDAYDYGSWVVEEDWLAG